MIVPVALFLALSTCVAFLPAAEAFHPQSFSPRWTRCNGSTDENNNSGKGDASGTKQDMDIFTKSSWYAVEMFGKAFGSKTSDQETVTSTTEQPPKSLDETLRRIREDNDRSYFLSGRIDAEIYDPNCVFADPFVSFEGRDRFIDNLQNLGSFITKYDARVLPKYKDSLAVVTPTTTTTTSNVVVETKLMVKLELNLPWKPVLAWPWGVAYTIDPETYLITEHVESWDIEPLEGVKMIFRKPTVQL